MDERCGEAPQARAESAEGAIVAEGLAVKPLV